MTSRTALLPLIAAACLPAGALAAEALSFERDVRPILKAHCFHCHGESGVQEGGLDVRLRRWIVAGGDSGEAVRPGEPEESLLLERVSFGEMPPGDKQLAETDVATIRDWIAQGARTVRSEPESLDDGDYFTEEERSFWSFQPIRRPEVPLLQEAQIDNPIDAFILDRLRQEGLAFSEAADRYSLARRASLDLWGLPPTPEMVEAFVHSDSPNAYGELIDRLLASPRYGERWGRHWLDVAGYADSDGYTDEDTEREFAYFYRDYVIGSFNRNKPLDQFVCEQLAGDEMEVSAGESSGLTSERIERLAATGFLRTAPDGTASGSVDRQLAANETIADTIEIVSTSLLGLTVACARCHDHRYDPISQADYYRFRAIFEPALDWKQWKTPAERQLSLYTEADKQARATVESRAQAAEAARANRQQEHIDRTLYEELLVVPDEVREALQAAYQTEKKNRSASQVALLEEYPSVGNISPGSLYLYAEQRARRASDIEKAADERESRYVAEAQAEQLANVPNDQRDELRQIVAIPPEARTEAQRALAAEFLDRTVTSQSLQELRPSRFAEIQRYREAARICREQDAKTELAEMQDEIEAIRSTAPKENFLRILTEPADHQPATHLFIRGDYRQPGPPLQPDELTVLQTFVPAEIASNDASLPTTGRRLAYARHLTSGKHPLLARVLVNRVWLHHFGRGLVDSPGDFGRLGSRPTHPQLLDWLSDDLMRSGWDLKRLHRLIMLSQTYRQSSRRSEHLDRIDPDNRLYARASIRRLESESLRDAMLLASGELLEQMRGPPIPVKEDAVGQIVLGKEMLDGERKPSGRDEPFDGAYRRSVYVQVRRSRPLAVLETFDLPTVSPNCAARNFSNVATQSLLLMNSQFAIDRANALAAHLMRRESELAAQLATAWHRCFGRPILPDVLEDLKSFVGQQQAAFQSRDTKPSPEEALRLALASVCQALFSSNQFLYID